MQTYINIVIFFLLFTIFINQSIAHEIKFTVTPINTLDINKEKTWVIALPNYLIDYKNKIKLLNSEGQALKAAFQTTLFWPTQTNSKYLRAIIVSTNEDFQSNSFSLTWEKSESTNLTQSIASTKISYDVLLSKDFLSLILPTPYLPLDKNLKNKWFDNAHIRYGNFINNPELLPKHQFDINTPSIWLYDRAYNLYLLYIKTGELKWKKSAHEAAQFYKSKLTKQGYFSLKETPDLKYANTRGLLYDYIFYPDASTKQAIKNIYTMTLTWSPEIKKEGFWTERHHSVAFETAISHWLINNNPNIKSRVNEFVENAHKYITLPYNKGCLKHSYLSHEGKNLETSVCSPWMSALIIEQFWRYHFLTDDYKSATIIAKFGTFLSKDGLFNYTYGKEFSAVPKYLTLFSAPEKEKNSAWVDLHHACDVASAMAKSAYFKADNKQLIQKITDMLKTCQRSMNRSNPNDAWPLVPARKFNWWYGTTSSFTWLLKELKI